jgi:hypothetical protein
MKVATLPAKIHQGLVLSLFFLHLFLTPLSCILHVLICAVHFFFNAVWLVYLYLFRPFFLMEIIFDMCLFDLHPLFQECS